MNGLGASVFCQNSAPSRQNRFRLHDLFGRAGEVEFKFSRPAGDEDFDGVESAGDHAEAELFVDFTESMLLEAFAHVGASVRAGRIAMQLLLYFQRSLPALLLDKQPNGCILSRPDGCSLQSVGGRESAEVAGRIA